MHCISTGLHVAHTGSVGGEILQVDTKIFVNQLYKVLGRFADPSELKVTNQEMVLLLRCLHLALFKKKEIQSERIAAFLKRLATVASVADPHHAVPLMAFSQALFEAHPKMRQLLGSEKVRGGLLMCALVCVLLALLPLLVCAAPVHS